MDHQRHYKLLCARGNARQKAKGFDRHRILPGCLGGKYIKSNIAYLTPREHFIAHLLLEKMYHHPGILWATFLMSTEERYNSKDYARLRQKALPLLSENGTKVMNNNWISHEFRERHRERLSVLWSDHEFRERHAQRLRDRTNPGTLEHVRQLSAARGKARLLDPKKNPNNIPGVKEKQREATKARMSNLPVIVCPHCGKSGKGPIMKRYHFNKCTLNT